MAQSMDNVSDHTDIETSSIASVEEILINNRETDANSEHSEEYDEPDLQTNQTGTGNNHEARNMDQKHQLGNKWRLHAMISFKHPKRTYTNANGPGEISTWDLVDETGSINIIAFNLHSNSMSNKLIEGKAYEFSGLSIKSVDQMYKNLPNDFQLMVTNTTRVKEIQMNFNSQTSYNFINLGEIESMPLNTLIDVQVQVLRDYGITTGYSNDNAWTRRELHIGQNGDSIRLTMWNDLAKKVPTTMVNMKLKIKNVKISWFGGSRTLVTLSNTRLAIE